MIPTSVRFDQSTIASMLDVDPLVQDYRAFFSLLDWSVVERGPTQRSNFYGSHGHPLATYIKAFLIRIKQGFIYATQLRDFLAKHPLLVIELGFQLELDPNADYGFDVERTLPCRYWLGEKLRQLDHSLLQDLLAATVAALKEEIPGLGEVVAFDVKHLYAWVKENNERAYVKDRYDKTHKPVGDPDCALGVKRRTNLEQADGSSLEKVESLWGYGSGVAAATVADYGDVVLAEYTQPFNENDITYFRPLNEQAILALGHFPTHITADAAYDAWYVYDGPARRGGIAAVPLNRHGHLPVERNPDGVPLCAKGLPMHPTFTHNHTYGYKAKRYRCPLLHPKPTGETCEQAQFAGKGCVKDINIEAGGIMRVMLNRTSPLYKVVYNQRTCCERINSQAKELGIEHPKVRNRRSVTNLNTLIYLVINVRALHRAKLLNSELLPISQFLLGHSKKPCLQ
jgi:hypothetical protein